MSLLARFKRPGPSGFGYASAAQEVIADLDLTGERFLLTGCNSGIGQATLQALVARGGHVVAAARTAEKARAACQGLEAQTTPVACELSEPDSVRACVETVAALGQPLDAIICNAGIMALPTLHQAHGYELQFFTNHIGHFLLVTGLLDALTDDGRVVVVSSDAHRAAPKEGIDFDDLSGERRYKGWRAYGQSKLANLLFARHLARRFEDDASARVAVSIHPGVIKTNLGRHMNPLATLALKVAEPLLLKTLPQGAATQTYAAAHPDAARFNGAYLADCNVARSSSRGRDMALAARLWDVSEEIARQTASA